MSAVVLKVLKWINDLLSAIPGLVWAVALAFALVALAWSHHETTAAQAARDAAVGEKNQVLAQLAQQKREAAAELAQLTAARDALQAQVNDAHRAQEIKDANDRKIIADQAARLRALAAAAPGGQLRDPNAAGCGRGGQGPEGHAAADERGGANDAAASGGLLSAPLSRLLLDDASDADKWGRLYGLARADAMTCRAAHPSD